jgi:hypothetical protein
MIAEVEPIGNIFFIMNNSKVQNVIDRTLGKGYNRVELISSINAYKSELIG